MKTEYAHAQGTKDPPAQQDLQHRVEHKTTNEIKFFGIEHLKEHLGIEASTVALIKKGFDAVDYELDEILAKLQIGWQPDPDLFNRSLNFTDDIAKHLALGLPLLDRQVRRLRYSRPAVTVRAPGDSLPAAGGRSAGDRATLDLFTWNEAPPPSPRDALTLPSHLFEPIEGYLRAGIRSARAITELLIREHGASDARYSTGKPHIFTAVCWHIEQHHPELQIEAKFQDDRHYSR